MYISRPAYKSLQTVPVMSRWACDFYLESRKHICENKQTNLVLLLSLNSLGCTYIL